MCIICFLIIFMVQSSLLYQRVDVERLFDCVSHEKKVVDVAVADTEIEQPNDENTTFLNNLYEEIQSNDRQMTEESVEVQQQEIEAALGLHKSDWNLLLVNKQHPLPEDYSFPLGTINKGMKCDIRIIPKLRNMMDAAGEDGIILSVKSPYRDGKRQKYLFDRKVKSFMKTKLSYLQAYKEAAQVVTVPGSSEHQIGLALDIASSKYSLLEQDFGETEAGLWLEKHAHEYGFILRYPKGKEDITGITYEPWHFRYVGETAATYIYEKKLALEEYVQLLAE